MRLSIIAGWLCLEAALGQYVQQATPVPILKQINRHNEDGSYSYGYEAADGSYKIESKYPSGEVYGKYGFLDDTGSLREVEYGASQRGFEPAGTGINVPPPTLHGNSLGDARNEPDDDGQYREDPSVYYTDPRYTNGERYDPLPKSYAPPIQQRYNSVPSKSMVVARLPTLQPTQLKEYSEYQPKYKTQYQRRYRLAPAKYSQPQPRYNLVPSPYTHTATPGLGSYSVNYRR